MPPGPARATRRLTLASLLRLLGAALVVYGVVGLALTVYGYGLVREAFANARSEGLLAPEERNQAIRSLDDLSVLLDDASDASGNLATSFDASQASLTEAAGVARDLAESLRQLSGLINLAGGGAGQMTGVGQPFQENARRLDALAEDLTRTGTALGANAADTRRLATDFALMRSNVSTIRRAAEGLADSPSATSGADRLETALGALLTWVGLQSAIALAAGLAILVLPGRARASAP